VFLYGTLLPGHLRWGLIDPFATGSRPDVADGQLYDTGRGWPAARFAAPVDAEPVPVEPPPAGDATIPGWLVDVDPSAFPTLIRRLDEVEGAVAPGTGDTGTGDTGTGASDSGAPGGTGPELFYRRVRIRTRSDTEAWAYEALVVGDGWRAVPEWSTQPEN
jgi:gamma-glutamylcyclotransferase (GGCT)/AIG2-like uncharacterized protein YtfP